MHSLSYNLCHMYTRTRYVRYTIHTGTDAGGRRKQTAMYSYLQVLWYELLEGFCLDTVQELVTAFV